MTTQRMRFAGWLAGMLLACGAHAQALQGTAFTYQGELVQNGTPVAGTADFVFELFDAPSGGLQVGPTLSFTTANGNPVAVTAGLFTVALDFGASAFSGTPANARWLRVTVNGNVLAPRTKIENAPFALLARNAELAFTVPASSIGASEVDAAEVQLRGAVAACAMGQYVQTIGVDGNVTCAADAAGTGDITGVTAGFGLSGGGTSGAVTVAVDTNAVQARGSSTVCPMGSVMQGIAASGDVQCVADANSGGDITAVTAGAGLTGGGTSGSVSLAADPNIVQARVTASCPPESSIRAIDSNGSVTCESDSFGATGTGWALGGNAGTTAGANYVGTTDAQPLELRVQGARAVRFEPTDQTVFSGQVNVIGGAAANSATAGTRGVTIGGGGSGDSLGANRATDSFGTIAGGNNNRTGNDNGNVGDAFAATVGGGSSNVASADNATVGGGVLNVASGIQSTIAGGASNLATATWSTLGGGLLNQATAEHATVAGGRSNAASANSSTVAGGDSNVASGSFSFVAGGANNTASGVGASTGGGNANAASGLLSVVVGGQLNAAGGDYSLAAGRRVSVRDAAATGEAGCSGTGACGDEGTFAWADSRAANFVSDGPNRFLVRATGGAKFVTAIDALGGEISGVRLAAGGGAWETLSDRDAKTDLAAIDPLGVLERVLALPISRWRYRAQDAVRHLGPMAQDFHAAFGLGSDERHIATVDADGVALAAIQGLNAKLEAEVAALSAENARLAERLARLEAAVAGASQ